MNERKKYELAVFIGRGSPLHFGHISLVLQALNHSEKVLILIGSAGEPRTPRCPWTYEERKNLWEACLPNDLNNLIIEPLYDHLYNDQAWISQVQQTVAKHSNQDSSVAIIGCDKDETSWYLHAFPQWKHIEMSLMTSNNVVIHATDIRKDYFLHDTYNATLLPPPVCQFLDNFRVTPEYQTLVDEFKYALDYRAKWANSPFPPTFTTVDSVVIQSGHVLLVQRKKHPQKGAYAIPGGFLNQDESLLDGALRELEEETKIKVPEKVLRGSIETSKVYDYPKRSQRGRVLTYAFKIKLKDDLELPKVRGSDDAEKALWVPIAEVLNMRSKFFEDHYHILRDLLGL